MKKAWRIVLALCVLLVAVSGMSTASAQGQWYTENAADGTCTITGFVGQETDLVIPAEIDGHTVTAIGESAFTSNASFETVTIPEGVTSIGKHAFYWCSNIQSITLPDSVETIGEGAFGKCYALTSLTLPAALTEFDPLMVHYCRVMSAMNVSPSNETFASVDGVLYTKDGETLLYYPPCKEGTAYAVPEGVKTIAGGAFDDCGLLCELTLPASLTTIEEAAFIGCRELATITYQGKDTAWSAVTIGADNEPVTGATVVFAPASVPLVPIVIGGAAVAAVAVVLAIVILKKRKSSLQ